MAEFLHHDPLPGHIPPYQIEPVWHGLQFPQAPQQGGHIAHLQWPQVPDQSGPMWSLQNQQQSLPQIEKLYQNGFLNQQVPHQRLQQACMALKELKIKHKERSVSWHPAYCMEHKDF
jgi:hypothetical protein